MKIDGLGLRGGGAGLAWRETRVPGVSWIPLHLEEGTGLRAATGGNGSAGRTRGGATVLIRMAPGRGYAPHRHLGAEDVLVLLGGYADERGTYRQGEHVHYPPGSVHAPRALGDPDRAADETNPPCILYSTVPEGIELIEPQPEGASSP